MVFRLEKGRGEGCKMLNLSLTYVCILTFFQIPFYKQRLLWYHEIVNLRLFSEEWVQAHSLILCADAHAARHAEK